jgi:glutathione peroxidase
MSLYEIPLTTIDGQTVTLDRYRGKRLLIVNVASRCGFTPQYKALEELYRRRKDDLVVLGFPCNQFGRQEPGSNEEIRRFCDDYYSVTFPLFARIEVNGTNAHPLFRFLKAVKRGFLGREAYVESRVPHWPQRRRAETLRSRVKPTPSRRTGGYPHDRR